MRKTNPICPVGQGSRDRNVQNEANFGGSFKCEVSSVKLGNRRVESSESSYFKLYTSNFRRNAQPPKANRAKRTQFPAGCTHWRRPAVGV